jgi:serine/threonine protein kinase
MPPTVSGHRFFDQRFELEAEHGRGGMGTVWKARDRQTQGWVALKLLHDQTPEQTERFVREGGLLAQLSHPNIVGYVAHGQSSEGTPYLAMEWLEGENLAQRLERGRLDLLESTALLRSVLGGLAAVHSRGIVHRDLKPSNLFLRGRSVDAIGFGAAAPGQRFPALYMWGAPPGQANGVYRSDDEGASWLRINDDAHEFGGLANGQFILGDANVYGRVYMSSAGRGILVGTPEPRATAHSAEHHLRTVTSSLVGLGGLPNFRAGPGARGAHGALGEP